MDNDSLDVVRSDLRETARALMLLRSEMNQREERMTAAFNQQMHALHQDVGRFRTDISGIVSGASSQIARDAKDAVSPVAAEYDRAVSATSARLQGASKTVWMWFSAAGAILLLVLLIGWAVVGYYRRELTAAQEELQRNENAIPVVQAFYASDAVLCGERICVNIEPEGLRVGNKRQYRHAKLRAR